MAINPFNFSIFKSQMQNDKRPVCINDKTDGLKDIDIWEMLYILKGQIHKNIA